MSTIADNLARIRQSLPPQVRIVAVSKFHPVEQLMEAYDAGQRIFGESRQQELLQKIPQMPADTVWHFIGHLQTNKVRSIVGRVDLIESVDTERLLQLIDQEAQRAGVLQRVLLQVHVAMEETKFGFSPDELYDLIQSRRYLDLQAVDICGIMGMASNTDDAERVGADFGRLADCYDRVRALAHELTHFEILSMGMSDDYPLAVAHGSNLVRIGTAIFGARKVLVTSDK